MNSPSNSNIYNKSSEDKFLVFSAGSDKYGIPLLEVVEVIAVPTFTDVPFTPAHFCGIINLRGQVISVLDLRKKLKTEKNVTENEESVIICSSGNISLGILVDSVNFVHVATSEELSEKPKVNSKIETRYITHVCRRNSELILMIDLVKILDAEDHAAIKQQLQVDENKTA